MHTNKTKYIFRGILVTVTFLIVGLYLGTQVPWTGFIKFIYDFAIIALGVLLMVHTLWDADTRDETQYGLLLDNAFLPVRFPKTTVTILILIIIGHKIWLGAGDAKVIYNKSIVYNKEYAAATQNIQTFYDKMWKTYSVKKELTQANEQTFIEVATIIMTGRADGQNVAWKWSQENSPIPFGEFTSFYHDLSEYIEGARDQYYVLETTRQNIAKNHNTMLAIFPNNVYNWFLGRQNIQYAPGFLSDSTNTVFEQGVENVK